MKQERVMLEFLFSVLAALRVFLRSRSDTALEVLALRQQVAVLKRQRPRPTLTRLDRFFWTSLGHLWPRWSDVLLIVKPETVAGIPAPGGRHSSPITERQSSLAISSPSLRRRSSCSRASSSSNTLGEDPPLQRDP